VVKKVTTTAKDSIDLLELLHQKGEDVGFLRGWWPSHHQASGNRASRAAWPMGSEQTLPQRQGCWTPV